MSKPRTQHISLMYRNHDSSGEFKRVWQSTWGGDQFEVFGPDMFDALTICCEKLSIPLLEAAEDD